MLDFIDELFIKQDGPFFSLLSPTNSQSLPILLFQHVTLHKEKVEGIRKIYSFETGKLIQTISYVHGIQEMPL
jgi:hypothetical protein